MRRIGLWAVALAYACVGPSTEAGISVQVDTEQAGIGVVTSRVDGLDPEVSWTVDPLRAVLIGTVDGPDETRFGRLAAIVVDAQGQIFVPDGQAQTVRVFDAEGEYLRSIGRPGEGPGEFRSLDGVALDGSDLLARDPMLNRISRFDGDGRFVTSFVMERPFAQFSDQASLWADQQGVVYDFTQIGTTMSVDSLGVVAYRSDGGVDTVVTHVAEPRRLLLRDAQGEPRAAALVPFMAFGRATVSPAGIVFAGSGAAYDIAVYEESVLARRIVKVETARTVPAWAADTVEAVVGRLRDDLPGGTVDRDELPDSQPYFNGLVVDPLGYLWVQRAGLTRSPSDRFDIFDPAGAYLGHVKTPDMILDQVGEDFIAGRTRDDLGVERALVVRLDRGAPVPG